MSRDSQDHVALGLAALSICESLIICLVEKGLLDAMDFEAILESAEEAHERSTPEKFSLEDHNQAAAVIRKIISRSNSVRGAGSL
jgi:hypothetical protein